MSLPHSVSPGETVNVELKLSRDRLGDAASVTVDLVREGIFWFSEVGSEPRVLPVSTA